MGVWSFLKGKVAEIEQPFESAGEAERYASEKAQHADLDFEHLSQRLTANKEAKKLLEQNLKDVNLTIKVLERLVIEKLEAAGIESIVVGGYRLTPSPEPSFKKADGQALRAWVTETGQEDLLTIHANTLATIAKNHFLEHGAAPPGVELSGLYTKLSRTKQR